MALGLLCLLCYSRCTLPRNNFGEIMRQQALRQFFVSERYYVGQVASKLSSLVLVRMNNEIRSVGFDPIQDELFGL